MHCCDTPCDRPAQSTPGLSAAQHPEESLAYPLQVPDAHARPAVFDTQLDMVLESRDNDPHYGVWRAIADHILDEIAYPLRPITLVVFVPPGGSPDIVARMIGQTLSPRLGQPLLLTAVPHAVNVTLYEKQDVDLLPDVPAVAETVPGYAVTGWLGIGAPKGTPPEIVDRLNREVNTVLADPAMLERLASLGSEPFTGSPADFGKFLAEETEKWAKVVKFANLKVE